MKNLIVILLFACFSGNAQRMKISQNQAIKDSDFGNKYRLTADTYFDFITQQPTTFTTLLNDSTLFVVNQTAFPPFKIKSFEEISFKNGDIVASSKIQKNERISSLTYFSDLSQNLYISSQSDFLKGKKRENLYKRYNVFDLANGSLVQSIFLVKSVGGNIRYERDEYFLSKSSHIKKHPSSNLISFLTKHNTLICYDIALNEIALEVFVPNYSKRYNYFFSNKGESIIIETPHFDPDKPNTNADSVFIAQSVFNDNLLTETDKLLGFYEYLADGDEYKVAYSYPEDIKTMFPHPAQNTPKNIICSDDDNLRVAIYPNGLILIFKRENKDFVYFKHSIDLMAPQYWKKTLNIEPINRKGVISFDNKYLVVPGINKQTFQSWKKREGNLGGFIDKAKEILTHGDLGEPTFLRSDLILSVIDLENMACLGSFFDSYTDNENIDQWNTAYAAKGKREKEMAKRKLVQYTPTTWFLTPNNKSLYTTDRSYDFELLLKRIKI